MIELRFLHSALPLIAVYQCIAFHLISFDIFRDSSGQADERTKRRLYSLPLAILARL